MKIRLTILLTIIGISQAIAQFYTEKITLDFIKSLPDSVRAETEMLLPTETAEFRILTTQPGDPMYSKFGHTAVQFVDSARQINCVFNYGVFDFNSPNFIPLFIAGRCNYMLDCEPAEFFYESCRMVGRYNIYSETLNLTYDEICSLYLELIWNLQPQNRNYRYNFVFKNCATEPYRKIKQVYGSELHAPKFEAKQMTFRDAISYYSGKYTWMNYVLNLLFGRHADEPMKPEQRLFLPEQMMDFFAEATTDDGRRVVTDYDIAPFEPKNGHWYLSPRFFEVLLLLLCFGIGLYDYRHKKISWWLDGIIMCLFALFGTLLFYLQFFSSHPLVEQNVNIIMLTPLLWIPFVMMLTKKGRQHLQSRTASMIASLYFIFGYSLMLISHQQFLIILPAAALLTHCLLSWWAPMLFKIQTSNNTSAKQ